MSYLSSGRLNRLFGQFCAFEAHMHVRRWQKIVVLIKNIKNKFCFCVVRAALYSSTF